MPFAYDLAVGAYHAAVRAAAPFNTKARAWVAGREGLWDRLEARKEQLRGCLWMHCASVGEFEQGRPVLEAIKAARPDLPVLLTFFSPSGYEARKDYPLATHVDYLPPDSAENAGRLVDMVGPRAAIFVKYEFWYHHLRALKEHGVPVFLVSGIFRPDQPFFKWYGGAWRRMLGCYARICVQDEASKDLLAGVGITNVAVTGDTRFDRVAVIVGENHELDEAARFRNSGDRPVLVCGSTWPADDDLIRTACAVLGGRRPRFIVAPHELSAPGLDELRPKYAKRFRNWSDEHFPTDPEALIVDRMGLLARLYKYGDIAYVGGGFTDGIHSLLEAAAWGKPVIFGPKHTKFAEAKGLIDAGGGFQVRNVDDLRAVLDRLLGDADALARAGAAAGKYVRERVGATERTAGEILRRIG